MINKPSASAYLLVIHGSPDSRPLSAAKQLAQMVEQQQVFRSTRGQNSAYGAQKLLLRQNPPIVGTASLEFAPLPLCQSIEQFALQAYSQGFQYLKILPLFLLEGVHVRTDIPKEVAWAQKALGEKIKLQICPYLGSNPAMVELLAQQFALMPAQGRILISHGSRRCHANQKIAEIASQLKATAAYWSLAPSLEEQVKALVAQSYHTIAMVPYFLFRGGITGAIASQVEQLQTKFPQTKLILGNPIGASPQLAQIIVSLCNFSGEELPSHSI